MRNQDIYEMLNKLEPDETDFIELPADELERRRVKEAVRSRIEGERSVKQRSVKSRKEKNKNHRALKTAVACAAALVVGVSGFGLALPTYAREVPVVGDIFRYLDDGRTGMYDLYQERASDIDMTKEGGGLRVTLDYGVFDGTTLTLAYTVKSEKDLGERPVAETDIQFDRKLHIRGWGGSARLEKVSEGVYVGMETVTYHRDQEEPVETLPFMWTFQGVRVPDLAAEEGAAGDEETIKGGLHFNVELTALNRNVRALEMDGREPEKGVDITLGKLAETDVNTTLSYTMRAAESLYYDSRVDWTVSDDLGNIYETDDLGGSAKNIEGEWIGQNMICFTRVDPAAKKLIITPEIYYAGKDESGERIWNNDTAYPLAPQSFEIPLGS